MAKKEAAGAAALMLYAPMGLLLCIGVGGVEDASSANQLAAMQEQLQQALDQQQQLSSQQVRSRLRCDAMGTGGGGKGCSCWPDVLLGRG